MASVDDRIVAMKFDNAAFEQKIATTIASLDKLKGSLDFANSKRGLDDLSSSSKNFSLEGIAAAVSNIENKFSAMGAIALSVINNIVTAAINAGVSIVKSLSLDQVLAGFHEYETNMNAIQTVLANTKSDATTLDDVNKALDTLNTYSDQTIYNFSQMARNVGTFTAAGVSLDASVAGIKGIANLAAVSGSNADQASSAMYQLSQALASGTVKLIDWNSVVNAGMGGEVFQKALFETGKTLKTIKGVPIKQTFEEWTAAGNTFRGSLESGWITAEVLTNTLAGFTGDLTEAQIKAMGYNDAQTAQILDMGKTAKEAATKVKTFTQLVSTVKESIGSGWSRTFTILLGNFDEARTLFTGINDAIGKIVSTSADSRNSLLQGWKDAGGRTMLIEGLTTAFQNLGAILKPIKAAFSDIFPPMTSIRLWGLTKAFKTLMESLTPSPAVVVLVTRAFRGIFAIFSIGWNIVKGIAGLFSDLFHMFSDEDPNTGILGFAARIGDGIVKLQGVLVGGGGIANFFDNLANTIYNFVTTALAKFDEFKAKVLEVVDYFVGGFTGMYTNEGEGILLFANKVGTALGKIKDWLTGLFDGGGTDKVDGVSNAFGRLGQRWGWLIGVAHILGGVWDALTGKFDVIGAAIGRFVNFIQEKFAGVPQKIADALSKGDYSQVLDTINTSLFGGLILMVSKFLSGGFLNNGLFNNISKTFSTLTNTLQTMQTQIKAEILFKIAAALALLTASIVVLSLIDSGALTKSMAAMAVGFGQLISVMALLDKVVSGPMGAAKLGILAAGLVLLAGAMLVLSVAVKILSTLSWEELSKGMIAITLLLAGIALAVKPISDNSGGMITTGLGIMAIAVALNILALAVKSFAEMQWEAMAQGLAGVATGLLVIVEAMRLMPKESMFAAGAGILLVSVSLNILALAVKAFAEMKWADMAKGMVGVAAALLLIAGAMHLMPAGMLLQGAGLVLIGIGLRTIALAIKALGELSWGSMVKGLVGIAAVLTILAIAAAAMENTIGGAVSILIMSVALGKLAKVLKEFAKMSWGELLKGLAGIGVVLAAIAIGALLMEPAIPALLGLGVALVLVGAGMALFGLGASLVATAFAVIATAGTEGVATLIGVLDALIGHLPAIIVAFGDGILQLAQKIVDALPAIIAGLDKVLLALLQLIIDNVPKIAETFKTLILSFIDVLVEVTPDIIAAGFKLLMDLLKGIRDNIGEITTTVASIIVEFLNALAAKTDDIITAGLGLLTTFLEGIANNIGLVVGGVSKIITAFIDAIATLVDDILDAGKRFIIKIIEGFGNAAAEILVAVGNLIAQFSDACLTLAQDIANAGKNFILGLLKIGADTVIAIASGMFDILTTFLNELAKVIDNRGDELRAAGKNIIGAVINGMTLGLADPRETGGFFGALGGFMGKVITTSTGILHVSSPSKIFIGIGEALVAGLAIGISRDTPALNSAAALSDRVITTFQNSLSQIPTALEGMDQFSPTITPVLDLTNVVRGASQLNSILPGSNMTASLSYNQAALIATSSNQDGTTSGTIDTASLAPREIKFEQNNYSPEALSTADIYRQTRNQIAMAKEELSVL